MQTTQHQSSTSHAKKPAIHFLIHEDGDNVGVAVVDLKAGEHAAGLFLDSRKPVEIDVKMDIPLGHKIALEDTANGATMMKYGVDVGKFVAAVKKGEHVHVHNVKTKRW